MSVQELWEKLNTPSYGWAGILILVLTLVEVSPLKFNPWAWFGSMLTKGLKSDLTEVKTDIKGVKADLEAHVAEDMRRTILDFQNSCLNHRKHTREEFTYIYKLCDKYEQYIEKTHVPNSEAEEAIEYIRKVYRKCLDKGAFLLPERSDDDD